MRNSSLFGLDLLEGLQWSMLPPRVISGSVVLMQLGSRLMSMAHINHRSPSRYPWSMLPPESISMSMCHNDARSQIDVSDLRP